MKDHHCLTGKLLDLHPCEQKYKKWGPSKLSWRGLGADFEERRLGKGDGLTCAKDEACQLQKQTRSDGKRQANCIANDLPSHSVQETAWLVLLPKKSGLLKMEIDQFS